MPERRNPVVRAGAILRKGGVHSKSVTGQRQRARLKVDDAIDEWYEDFNEPPNDIIDETHQCNHSKGKAVKRKSSKRKGKKGQSDTAPFAFLHCLQTMSAVSNTDRHTG